MAWHTHAALHREQTQIMTIGTTTIHSHKSFTSNVFYCCHSSCSIALGTPSQNSQVIGSCCEAKHRDITGELMVPLGIKAPPHTAVRIPGVGVDATPEEPMPWITVDPGRARRDNRIAVQVPSAF